MKEYLHRSIIKIQKATSVMHGFGKIINRLLKEQFNKNIYTRILFTNVIAFFVGLIILTMFSGYMVKQMTYDQVEQELLRKAKRVNFALNQQIDSKAWTGLPDKEITGRAQSENLLTYLADIFDTRITIFDKTGTILATSAQQEVVPGSKVEVNFDKLFTKGETVITQTTESETGQLTFNVVVPMGNNITSIENGILLEAKPSDLDIALNKMYFYQAIGGMVILAMIIIVSVYLAMYISRPISRLATTVAEISRGGYVLITDDQPLDEINILSDQLNKLTERLQKIQTESLKMDDERARLFAEISHELRTPLTAVQGFVEAIRDGMVQDEALQNRYLDTIYMQTVHITRLVDDMLVLSRLETGNIIVEQLPVDLIALVQGVVYSMEAVANRNNTSILLQKKTDKAVMIGDVDRIEQIIRNLLKNAIRASENGTIKVGLEVKNEEIILIIEDNGIGIPPDDLPHIWDRFYRVKNHQGRDERGSGLGLVIVKKLVQIQDGKIDVSSQLGKGTTFTISFPSFNQN